MLEVGSRCVSVGTSGKKVHHRFSDTAPCLPLQEHPYEEIQTSDGQANLLPTVYATVAPTHQLIYTTITFQGSTAAVPADSSKPYDANDSSSLARD